MNTIKNNSGFTLVELLVVLFIFMMLLVISYPALNDHHQDYIAEVNLRIAFDYYSTLHKHAKIYGKVYQMDLYRNSIRFDGTKHENRHLYQRRYELPEGYSFYGYKTVYIYGKKEMAPQTIAIQTPKGRREITIQLGGQYVIKE